MGLTEMKNKDENVVYPAREALYEERLSRFEKIMDCWDKGKLSLSKSNSRLVKKKKEAD